MSDRTPGEALTAEMIPPPWAAWETIAHFALSFNGYDYWGSLEKCADIANRWARLFAADGSLPEGLAELRTCLFFEQRRFYHFDRGPDEKEMKYIRALVEGIRVKVREGQET